MLLSLLAFALEFGLLAAQDFQSRLLLVELMCVALRKKFLFRAIFYRPQVFAWPLLIVEDPSNEKMRRMRNRV